MTKPLSSLITQETKAEDMFDLLKGGFSVDVRSIPIIYEFHIRQINRLEDRLLLPEKQGRDAKKFGKYPHDYSVFYALLLSYPMDELSENLDYSQINELYESFSKGIIDFNRSYLKRAHLPNKLEETDKEKTEKLYKLQEERNDEIIRFSNEIKRYNFYRPWFKDFKRAFQDGGDMLALAVNDYSASLNGPKLFGYVNEKDSEKRDSIAKKLSKEHPKTFNKIQAISGKFAHCLPYISTRVIRELDKEQNSLGFDF